MSRSQPYKEVRVGYGGASCIRVARGALVVAGLVLASAAQVLAQPSDSAVEQAPTQAPVDDAVISTIEVTAAPIEEATSDQSAFATVVQIRDQPAEGQTLTDVLDDSVGVQVRRFGGLGDFATVSIRGSSPGQVRIYLDGVPLTRARSETVNLADLPLDQLDRVEVYRGVSPLAVSASALGGVINLVTRAPRDEPSFSLIAGGGSFGTRKVSSSASMAGGPWSGFVSASYLGSEGDFSFRDDNGTPENPNDDETVDRENNHFDAFEGLAKVQYAFDDGETFTGVQEVFTNDQGVPGIGAFQSENANLRELRSLTYLRYRDDQVGDRPLALTGTGFFVFEKQDFRDLQGEIGLGDQATSNRTYVGGAGVEGEYLRGLHELVGRLDLIGEVFSPKEKLADEPNGPNQSRITLNSAIGDTFGLFGDRLILQPSFRYEFVHDDFGGSIGPGGGLTDEASGGDEHLFTPRLGVSVIATPWLTFKGNAGRYARMPNFTELFGNRGSVVGNPGLDPERGVNADIGFVAETGVLGPVGRSRLEVAGFYSDVDDQIVLVQNSQRTSVPRNVGSAQVLGLEVSGRMRAWERFALSVNYTLQDARDESGIPGRDGNKLPGRPKHEVYARTDVDIGPVRPFYELNFIAENFLDQANFREVSSRTIHTAGLHFDVPKLPLELTFEARNLGDEQIEDVAGFPLPGRSYFGTLAWRWAPAGEEPS